VAEPATIIQSGCGMVKKLINPKMVKIIPTAKIGTNGLWVFILTQTNPAMKDANAKPTETEIKFINGILSILVVIEFISCISISAGNGKRYMERYSKRDIQRMPAIAPIIVLVKYFIVWYLSKANLNECY
jgi:hypothetical protein